ncbi:MAG: hypothetical protein Q9M36_01125 [Sulfurovum sp.]|nr:hypothetical protein [Sulfurovum sp.]
MFENKEESAILINDLNLNLSYIYNQQISFSGGLTYNIEEARK